MLHKGDRIRIREDAGRDDWWSPFRRLRGLRGVVASPDVGRVQTYDGEEDRLVLVHLDHSSTPTVVGSKQIEKL